MRWRWIGIRAATVFVAIGAASTNVGHVNLPRQDIVPSSQIPVSSSLQPSSGITSSSVQDVKTTQSPLSSEPSSTPSLSTFTTSTRPSITMPPITNFTSLLIVGNDNETLPLTPAITPALSVAGVLFILSGTFYALVGIKNRAVQIFLSAAYLTSLCITVLIIYVMNPPVSNAIQGAYFVGAFIPALLIGGGATIFKDITEGLGCVIGGFSVSMWILILRPGGTITSTGGKAIFIGLLCVAFFGLSFSHHTRNYALMGSTSIGGATAIVLGIDCFSQAGLKEFWLYIWSLNENLFPVLTITYPIMRGIRVETAAIIVITVIGVMSQFRVWKVIQEKRRKQILEKEEEEQKKEQAEEQIGRRLVARNEREQRQWEAAYGDSVMPDQLQNDSGIGTENNSLRKVSTSFADPRLSGGSSYHVIEMDGLDQSGRSVPMKSDKVSDGPRVSVYATRDDEGMQLAGARRSSRDLPGLSSRKDEPSGSRLSFGDVTNERWQPSATGAPALGPLAFEVSSSNIDGSDDTSFIATFTPPNRPQRRSSNRFSGSSLFKKLSKQSQLLSHQKSKSRDIADINSDQDNGAVLNYSDTVAATKPAASSQSRHIRENSIGISIHPEHVRSPESSTGLEGSTFDETSTTYKSPEERANRLAQDYQAKIAPASSLGGCGGSRTYDIQNLSDVSTDSASRYGLEGQLPEPGPRVAAAYRTNEWAKHLDRAEKPEVDRLRLLKPSKSQESDSSEEAAAPVDVHALQSTALGQQSSQSSYLERPRSPSNIPRNFLSEYMANQNSAPRSRSSTDSLKRKPVGSLSRKSSQQSDLSGQQGSPSALKTKGLRSSSTPIIGSPIVSSPIEEGVETTSFPTRYVPSLLAPQTLLSKRSSILQNKHLSTSHAYFRSSSTGLPASPSDPASLAIYTPDILDDDNLSLAQRRSILQAQSHIPRPQATYPLPTARQSLDPSARRASMLAAWRSSLNHDVTASSTPTYESEIRRAEMLEEMHQEKARQVQQALREKNRDVAWDQAMRRGDMQDAHREVLRRMQSGVNEKLKEEGA